MRKPRRRRRGKRWKPRRYRLRALCYRRFRYRLNLFPLRNAAAAAAVAAETSEAAAIGGGGRNSESRSDRRRSSSHSRCRDERGGGERFGEGPSAGSSPLRHPNRCRSGELLRSWDGATGHRERVLSATVSYSNDALGDALSPAQGARRRVEETGELVRRRDGELYVDAYGRMRRFHNSIMNERNTEPVRAAAVHGR